MHQRHVNAKGLTQTPCSRIAQTHLSLTLLHTPFLRSALPSHLARTRTAPSTQFTIIRLMRLPVTKLECKMTSVLRWESMLALWWKARSLPTRSSAAMRTTTTKQTALIGVKTTSAGWTHAPATRPMWQHLLGSSPLSYYYSYSQCGAADSFSADACAKQDDKSGCEGVATCKWQDDDSNDSDGAQQVATWLAVPSVLAVAMSQW